jgi:hypothetical protein
MARVEERRAASHFHQGQATELGPPLTPKALMAELGIKPQMLAVPAGAGAGQGRSDARGAELDRPDSIRRNIVDPGPEGAKVTELDAMEHQPIEDDRRSIDAATGGRPRTQAPREEQGRQARAGEDERQRQQPGARTEAQRLETLARENADQQVRQADDLRAQRSRLDRFEADRKRQAEQARQEEERKRESQARGKAAEGEIHDAGDRYRMALGQHYDARDPYGSLSRAAMGEYGAFIRDREQLTQEIAREKDPEARKALELRRDIEGADYMTITDRRIASQSEVSTGRRDNETSMRHRERAAEFEAQSQEGRQKLRELEAARAEREAAGKSNTADRLYPEQQPGSSGRATPQPESSAAREAKAAEHELTKGVEMTPEKEARIAKIMAQGRQFEAGEKIRQNSPGLDRGGRSR